MKPLYMPIPNITLGPYRNPTCAVRLYQAGQRVCFCGCGELVAGRVWQRGHQKRGPYWTTHLELAEARFWQKVEEGPEHACWEWQGSLSPQGYGHFRFDGKPVVAHRWLYEHWRGPVSKDLELDHLCRNRACVNPHHLEPVTPAENSHRSMSPMAINYRKTHCKRGHPFDEENTYLSKNGRACKTCKREYVRQWKERQREGKIAA